jgi:CpeT protein
MLRIITLLIFCTGVLFACNTSKKLSNETTVQLDELQRMMTGTFKSAEQAARDSAFFDISLQMYPIWQDKGHFLYVEQAVTAMQSKPYRQRIYQLEPGKKGTIRSVVYTLPDPEAYIGAWKKPSKFDQLSIDDLTLRKGCAVILTKQDDGSFTGSTDGNSCESTLRGASYATSKVTIKDGLIVSWDQGFNDEGEQVWGATKGGYEFKGLPKE